jgi:hypothetical protein
MTYSSIDELRTFNESYPDLGWAEKMIHKVPDAPVVDRCSYVCERCKDKRVLCLGCTGPMQDAVDSVATLTYGVDIQPCNRDRFYLINLDRHPEKLPDVTVDLIFAGEVFEHLSNPGNVLLQLRKYGCPLLASVPNGISDSGHRQMEHGIECVNKDHVAWYSWFTLTNLLGRYGYKVKDFAWYNGRPRFAEGLIVLAEV